METDGCRREGVAGGGHPELTEGKMWRQRLIGLGWVFLVVLSVALAVLAHWDAFKLLLVFDDFSVIGWALSYPSFASFVKFRFLVPTAVYRPLPSIIVYYPIHWFGLGPANYQIWSITEHFVTSILLGLLVWMISGRHFAAISAALFFSLNTAFSPESIWFASATEPRVAYLFALGAMMIHCHVLKGGSLLLEGFVALFYLAACLSHESCILLPVILALMEFIPLEGKRTTTLVRVFRTYFWLGVVGFAYLLFRFSFAPGGYAAPLKWEVGLHAIHHVIFQLSHFPITLALGVDAVDTFRLSEEAGLLTSEMLLNLRTLIAAILVLTVIFTRSRVAIFWGIFLIMFLLPSAFFVHEMDLRWAYLASAGAATILALFFDYLFARAIAIRLLVLRMTTYMTVALLFSASVLLMMRRGQELIMANRYVGERGQAHDMLDALSIATLPDDATITIDSVLERRLKGRNITGDYLNAVLEQTMPEKGARGIRFQRDLFAHSAQGDAKTFVMGIFPDQADQSSLSVRPANSLVTQAGQGS